MLTELRIVNFALLEELRLQFDAGFTILTGETGAGKSLIIDAIALLVGGRASSEHIRHGQEEASLEAAFSLPDGHPLIPRLREQGVLNDDASDLIVRRVLARSGRSRVYINGSLSPLHALEELGGTLVDIHGQHDQQSLLAPATQMQVVDGFGGLADRRAAYETVYGRWMRLRQEREQAVSQLKDRAGREDLLRFQHAELTEAAVQPGEEEALQQERKRLGAAQRIGVLTAEVLERLQADGQGVLAHLAAIDRALADLAEIDRAVGEAARLAGESRIGLKEVAGLVRAYADRLDGDPARLGVVEDRLALLQQLKKKYGGTLEAILEAQQRIAHELETLEGGSAALEACDGAIAECAQELRRQAQHLSQKRGEAAKRMAKAVRQELSALRMGQTVFEITVTPEPEGGEPGPHGVDRVEFQFSANPGEPVRPLSKVVSGGELSRVMLAIKTVLAGRDQVPVLIFDEIDTGVGGAMAEAIGERLRGLGRYHQVFAVTHLPQVAAQAHQHLCVEKTSRGTRTLTTVSVLRGAAREQEIARMLGGATITSKVRETAAELLASAGADSRNKGG